MLFADLPDVSSVTGVAVSGGAGQVAMRGRQPCHPGPRDRPASRSRTPISRMSPAAASPPWTIEEANGAACLIGDDATRQAPSKRDGQAIGGSRGA